MALMEHSTATDDYVGPRDTEGKNPDVDEAVNRLDRAVAALLEDDELLKNFLTYKGMMHNYSWLNTLLIYGDFLDRGYSGPVVCMGFKAWAKAGRQVRKGSKAIALFKPVLQYWRSYDNVTSATSGAKWDAKKGCFYVTRSKAVGFEIIRKTFHIQDTDGPDYNAPTPERLEDDSDAAKEVYVALHTAAMGLGVSSVEIEEMHPSYGGYYKPDDKAIRINSDAAAAQQAKTLAHELAHHICHVLELEHHDVYQATRGLAETVVEGAAFVVMASFGYDTSSFSVPYIAQWAGDMQKVRRLLRDIDKVSKVILNKLHPKEEESGT